MAKLTVKELESIKPERVGEKVREDGGLVGVIRARGDRVSVKFDWRYRSDGKVRSTTCGTWPRNSMPEIRAERDRLRRFLDEGKDPAEEKRAARMKARADQAERVAAEQTRISDLLAAESRITVADLLERWAAVELIRRKDGGKEIRRMFAKDVLPVIGHLAVEDVRKGHVTAVTDALLARGVTRMAKMIFSLIRQMLRFAVDRDIIESDPTAAIRKFKIGGKDVERDRVLSEDEIRALHRQIESAALMPTTSAAIWLALGTGCRIGELLRAEWRHVRLDANEWLIPSENSKNGRAHTVYLSDFVIEQFRTVQALNSKSKWCFPNRDDSSHVCVKTITKQLGDRQRGTASPMSRRSPHTNALTLPGGRWTPHDLRRTAATMMTALGILPEVAEKCLNHAEESRVKRTYQRHNYDAEKRDAWRLLGERLTLLTRDDGRVVTFPSRLAG